MSSMLSKFGYIVVLEEITLTSFNMAMFGIFIGNTFEHFENSTSNIQQPPNVPV